MSDERCHCENCEVIYQEMLRCEAICSLQIAEFVEKVVPMLAEANSTNCDLMRAAMHRQLIAGGLFGMLSMTSLATKEELVQTTQDAFAEALTVAERIFETNL
jgi:hypothetical protein